MVVYGKPRGRRPRVGRATGDLFRITGTITGKKNWRLGGQGMGHPLLLESGGLWGMDGGAKGAEGERREG